MMLRSYSHLLSTLASISTIPLFLSPCLICKDVIKKRSSDHIRLSVILGGLIRCILFYQWGVLLRLSPLMMVQKFGIVMHLIYLTLYYAYVTDKGKVLAVICKTATILSVVLAYANLEATHLVAWRFGIIANITHVGLMAEPLVSLRKLRSTVGWPLPSIICASVVSTLWLLHGISIDGGAVIFQLVAAALCYTKLILIFKDPERKRIKKKLDSKKD